MASSSHGSSVSASRPASLVELLRERAIEQPDELAYLFVSDGDEETRLTYREIDRQARAIAAWLQTKQAVGERALLLYPPGLAYIAAFFGCLYAGVVAIPAYPPRLNRPMPRLQAIVADARPTVALTTTSILSNIEPRFEHAPELKALQWLNSDHLPKEIEADWRLQAIAPETLAFLQYTSGSTDSPKGVMLSHGNLMANLAMIRHGFQIGSNELAVFWLPSYHDMGLIGGILEPMYACCPSVLISPASFFRRPARWLEVITRFRGTISGAPNFAYELCAEKVTPEQCEALDLSSLRLAFCGAEPVRHATLENFAEAFAPCGFRRDAFYPCYGLAEASLLVSGGIGPTFLRTRSARRRELEAGRVVEADASEPGAQTLVSCGGALLDQKIVIVESESRTLRPPDEVGEIWVSGANVAQGYWNRPEETEASFRATLAEGDDGPFLRTGDLGFFHDGELFIVGRLKDLIIIHGRNLYPQDIELTVERSHPSLSPGKGAAFSVELEGAERLVVVYEVDRHHRNPDIDEVVKALRRAVAEEHEVQVDAVVLIKTLSIPKTSSGKIQRFACRTGFLEGTLKVVAEWRGELPTLNTKAAGADVRPQEAQPPPETVPALPSASAIGSWLVSKISVRLGLAPEQIDPRQPFVYYGLDSVQAVSLTDELQTWLGRSVLPTLTWDYPTIESLSRFLAADGRPPTADSPRQSAVGGRPSAVGGPLSNEPIAIVGLGCRFPSAPNPEAFWQLLREGVDAISEVPADRWDVNAFYDPDPATPGKLNTRWGGFVEDIDRFDPGFFGISPHEAARMDPQQRLLLEVAWEALENAGLAPQRLAGSATGVFVGISSFDYSRFQFDDPNRVDAYAGTGNAHSITANRLSYLLDLHGPSMALDTACSSSLVAVHAACQSLRAGESDLAIAGGVNVLLRPELTITLSQARMMAADGRCKTFDADADGYVRGEGCGVIILKRLSDALRDGDNELALIRGTAVNQDGRSNGLTAPNGPAQQTVIRQALASAGVAPTEIGYIETHGTGTPLGDSIEFESLKAVLAPGRSPDQLCALGSVKTNIGHLEAAAGIAGLIKTVLVLQHGEIPPHLHLKQLNSHIALEGTPFTIPTVRQPWPANGTLRLAGVSSFGFGGTNAHAVLEAPQAGGLGDPERRAAPIERPLHLLTLSAQSENALKELAKLYANHLAAEPALALPDVCYTANTGRSHFPHRLAILAESKRELREKLQEASRAAGPAIPGLVTGTRGTGNRKRPKIAFLFTGQGSQYPGMGRRLFETQPSFRATLERCDELLRAHLGRRLLSVLYPPDGETSPLDETAYTQPALFALEYALAELWRTWGIEPDLVLGHSVGEYVAACVAGAFSLEDGLALIAERGRLMQALPTSGEMAVAFGNEACVAAALDPFSDRVSFAALNGPENTVISGEGEAVRSILDRLEAKGVKTQPLTVSHAFHSPLMEPMLADFERAAGRLSFEPLRIPLVSNLTGQVLDSGTRFDPGYWRRQVREPVRFAAGIQAASAQGAEAFVEIGPHPVLLAMGRRCLPAERTFGTWLPSLKRDQDDWRVLLTSLGDLYVQGVEVDWLGVDRDCVRRKVQLPTYPFERERFWIDVPDQRPTISGGAAGSQPILPANRRTLAVPAPATAPAQPEELGRLFYELRWEPRPRLDVEAPNMATRFLASPASIATQVQPRVQALSAEHGVAVYAELLPELDRLSTMFVVRALRQLGWKLEPGSRMSFQALVEQTGVVPAHKKLLRRMLGILCEDAVLKAVGKQWKVLSRPEDEDAEQQLAGLLERYPTCEPELQLISGCAPRLAQVLRGEVDPLHLIFPDGSLDAAEAFYQRSPFSRLYNSLVAETVAEAVAGLPAERLLRLLEVGAGTGGITGSVLGRLPVDRTEYIFSDVSALFTAHARRKFRDYQFLRTHELDIELDPGRQGVAAGRFDIVLAANVLHATADLRRTLRHVRQLLAPGGLLILLEAIWPQRWADLVFGLTEGWWKFADADVRRKHPLIPAEAWQQLLAETGFEESAVLPRPESGGTSTGQAVIVARAAPDSVVAGHGMDEENVAHKGRWLIFADRQGVGERLAEALSHRGENARLIFSDQLGTLAVGDRFQVNASRPDHLSRLLESLQETSDWRGIVHLWNLDAATEPATAAELEAAQILGCGSAADLIRELARLGRPESPRLWLVTRGAQPVEHTPRALSIAQATIWGLGRTMAQEQAGLFGGLVDLDPDASIQETAELLCEEIRRPDPEGENQIAFRRGQRYVARLVKRPPPAARARPEHWRSDGSYLITGGLGDLGLEVAHWMAHQGARRLILLGRTPLPPRARWTQLNRDDPLARKIAAIRELEALGLSVHLAAVDVADEPQLQAFLDQFRREGWPPIRGVLHLAGVVEDRLLSEFDAQTLWAVLRPKVVGAWTLHRLLADEPIEHFVMFSSVGSLLGLTGQAAYAAANAFLDGLAHHRRGLGLPALTVNWGPWDARGVANRPGGRLLLRQLALQGIDSLPPPRALEALGGLIGEQATHAVVLSVDWPRFREYHLANVQSRLLAKLLLETPSGPSDGVGAKSPLSRDRLMAAEPGERRREAEAYLREQVARVLGQVASRVDVHRPLNTLGLDSLMAVELTNRIDMQFGVVVPMAKFLEGQSLADIAAFLVDQIANPVQSDPFAGPAMPTIDRESAGQLLSQLEDLSGADLDSLLQQMLGEKGPE